ncbi:MAG: thiamine pyrophosphate-binding protein [Verrucomicrobia bacterium]|nr:thiamine pyrophosphate-binding protein [Verrucomicrobiota bacterium]
MKNPTVAQYTLTRLSQLGIDRIFGVPGDYAFPIDDAAEQVPGLEWVVCANELNAAYAADGYARIRGAAMLTTTYGVGELSAINGVMGSLTHRLPVFHLVGMPSERIQIQNLITHHNLGDTNYHRFLPISGAAAGVTAVLTPTNCVEELERVIREALRLSKPAYIAISELSGYSPIVGTPVTGNPLAEIKRQTSVPAELESALATILLRLEAAKNPVAIVTALTARYGLRAQVHELLRKINLPTAIAPAEKGSLDESIPQFIGLYHGDFSSPASVKQVIESADLVLDIGGIILAELNAGLFTDNLAPNRMISIRDSHVQIGTKVFVNTAIDDVLAGLLAKVKTRPQPVVSEKIDLLPATGNGDDKLSSANFYPRLQRCLKSGDTLVVETGTCMMHLNPMVLPKGVGAEGQGLWGSIGWATPATLGVCLAKKSGRTWMVTGDGSHQLTLNEIGVMGRYGIKPIIFVLNNDIYGVEDFFSDRGHIYDDIARLNYHLLPEAFGCKGWLTAKVGTLAELDDILGKIEKHDGAAYIQVLIPEAESQPLPAEVIDHDYKLRIPPVG